MYEGINPTRSSWVSRGFPSSSRISGSLIRLSTEQPLSFQVLWPELRFVLVGSNKPLLVDLGTLNSYRTLQRKPLQGKLAA